MMNIYIYIACCVLSTNLYGASVWTGTITTTHNTLLLGSVDYEVNTTTDVLTLSNHQGDWATAPGPSQAVTLYALSDFTSTGGALHGPAVSTFDVTDAHFQSDPAGGLASVAGDGWYWASSTDTGSFFHLILGADAAATASLIVDYNPSNNANQFLTTPLTASSANDFGPTHVSFSTPVLVPEASSMFLLAGACVVVMFRRQRSAV